MRTLTLLVCVALTSLSGCAANNSKLLDSLPDPIACDANARRRCEFPAIEPEGAPLGETEEIDAINRERWRRCALRHNAAMACFDALEREGFVAPAGKSQ